MVRVHRIFHFPASHSLSMQEAMQCILVAQCCVSRDRVSDPHLHKVESRLIYANQSKNSQKNFLKNCCQS